MNVEKLVFDIENSKKSKLGKLDRSLHVRQLHKRAQNKEGSGLKRLQAVLELKDLGEI